MVLIDVEKIADLAKIRLTKEEQKSLREDLVRMVAFAEELTALGLDTESSGEAMISFETDRREDLVQPGPPRDVLLSNAPKTQDGYIDVPRVVREGEK